MVNKIVMFISLAVIVALATGAVTICLRPAQPMEQTPQIRLIDFQWTTGWETPGGLQAIKQFNVTVENRGSEVEGITFDVNLLDPNGSRLDSATGFFGPGVIGWGAELEDFNGTFSVGEVRLLRGIVITNWGVVSQVDSCVAELKVGNDVLDR